MRQESWAHKLFITPSLHPSAAGFLPLEGCTGIGPGCPDHVHLVVAGANDMGIALGLEAAMLGHYPNFRAFPDARTRITFAGPDAGSAIERLRERCPGLFQLVRWRSGLREWVLPQDTGHLGGDFLDFELEFLPEGLDNPEVAEYLEQCAGNPHTRLTVAVCQDSAEASAALAEKLPQSVLDAAVQVLVYQLDRVVVPVSGDGLFRTFGTGDSDFDSTAGAVLLKAAGSMEKDPGKGPVDALANFYSAANIWTKLRSAASEDGKIPAVMRDVFAWTEHNRWNTEQLLSGLRPLTRQEQEWALEGGSVNPERKKALKNERGAHLDICSWERLQEIDPETVAYDYNMVDSINRI